MKAKYIYLAFITLVSGILWGCSDWTEAEAEDFFEPMPSSYYESLRAYKKSDHQIAFGWFGNWTGAGASQVNCMRAIPDSVDVISIWGNWHTLTDNQKEDLKYMQEVKGTKALLCFIVANVGDQLTPAEVGENFEENGFSNAREAINDYWGWEEGNEDRINEAIKKYANGICDTIMKYNYDGFDIDYEPHYGAHGNMASFPDRMLVFIKALRERLGTREETGKMVVIDGEPQSIHPEAGKLLDYFIVQAYQCGGDYNLDNRLNTTISNFEGVLTPEEVAKKYVVTENFESFAQTGGVGFTDRYGNRMQSLEGMARWTPIIDGKKVKKGGVGTYHMEYDYPFTPEYKWLRAAIQIMNPCVK